MRVAIVNDQRLTREVLRRLVTSAPGHIVAWSAENGAVAVERAGQDRPDAILMDLVMPVMDGVEATRRIMSENPCPILLVTSSVTGNFNMVYQAMGYGALDAVNTPTCDGDGRIRDGAGVLDRLAKLAQTKQLAGSLAEAACDREQLPLPGAQLKLPPLVLIGASTGGPEALAQVLGNLPPVFAGAVVLAQHIAADFAPSLTRWLGERSRIPVDLLRDGDEPKIGRALLAGTDHHVVVRSDRSLAYAAEPVKIPYRPSVNVLFGSAATHWPSPGVAVLLTGMGNDGGHGLLTLRRLGWHTIAQDQATSVVYGMPRYAAELGAAREVLAVGQIASAIVAGVQRMTMAR